MCTTVFSYAWLMLADQCGDCTWYIYFPATASQHMTQFADDIIKLSATAQKHGCLAAILLTHFLSMCCVCDTIFVALAYIISCVY